MWICTLKQFGPKCRSCPGVTSLSWAVHRHSLPCPTGITCRTDRERDKGGLGHLEIPIVSDFNKKIAADYGVLLEDEGVALRWVCRNWKLADVTCLIKFQSSYKAYQELDNPEHRLHLAENCLCDLTKKYSTKLDGQPENGALEFSRLAVTIRVNVYLKVDWLIDLLAEKGYSDFVQCSSRTDGACGKFKNRLKVYKPREERRGGGGGGGSTHVGTKSVERVLVWRRLSEGFFFLKQTDWRHCMRAKSQSNVHTTFSPGDCSSSAQSRSYATSPWTTCRSDAMSMKSFACLRPSSTSTPTRKKVNTARHEKNRNGQLSKLLTHSAKRRDHPARLFFLSMYNHHYSTRADKAEEDTVANGLQVLPQVQCQNTRSIPK